MERGWSWQTVLLWVVALVLVNALWLNVAGQSAPNEINAENQFQPYREVNISPVFGSSSAIPATFEAAFSSTSVDDADVSFAIKLDNETVVHRWAGQLGDVVPVWTGELAPGTYTVETLVEDGVMVQQQLELKPLAAVQALGHAVLSALLVVLAWGEQGIRALMARRAANQSAIKTVEKAPFKAGTFSHEEDPLAWDEANDSPWRDPLR